MTGRIATLIWHDARLQYRYGIYVAYAFVVTLYALVLGFAGQWLPEWAAAVIVFTDPAAVGFFFLGALMMLEKSEGVRTALAVTPVSAAGYLIGKVSTLTGLALLACVVLLVVLHQAANPLLLLLAVALTSIQYVGIGVPIALRFKTVSGYLIGSAGFLTPLIAPGLVALLDPFPAWLAVIPAASQFRLMLVATGAAPAGPTELIVMLGIATAAAGAAVWLALNSLAKEFGR